MPDQATDSSEDEERAQTTSRTRKKKTKKSMKIKLVKKNKFLSNDKKKHSGKPEKIVGATQKFGELYFYIKFENKTKPVFVRAEGN